MTLPDPAALLQSTPNPPGTYTITPELHSRLVKHTFGDGVFPSDDGGEAHPVFAHLATHCGKSWTFDDFLAHVGAVPEDAVVFGGGSFAFRSLLRIGKPYRIDAWVSAATRKIGRRLGVFDAITMTHQATAEGEGLPTVRTTETFIVPRPGADPDAVDETLAGEIPPPAPKGAPDNQDTVSLSVGPVRIESIHEIMDIMGDTNPVHIDLELARRAGYRGRVNQGPANLAYLLAAVARWRGGISDLRWVSFQFRDTVTEDHVLEVIAPRSITTAASASARLEIQGIGAALVADLAFAG